MLRLLLNITQLSFILFAVSAFAKDGSEIQPDNLFPRVKIETNVGNIIVELDRTRAPITVDNFLSYAVDGSYDGTIIHRVVPDFVVQGGGYDILFNPKDQKKPIFNESGNGLKNEMYSIAMARENEPHTATNQFYFNLADNPGLDPGKGWGYAVFGMVMEGEDVVDTIGRAKTHKHQELGWEDVPVEKYVIKKVEVLAEE